jgi:hypothetical protein
MTGVALPPPGTSQPAQRAPPTDLNRVLAPDAIIATGVLEDPEGPTLSLHSLTVRSAPESPGAAPRVSTERRQSRRQPPEPTAATSDGCSGWSSAVRELRHRHVQPRPRPLCRHGAHYERRCHRCLPCRRCCSRRAVQSTAATTRDSGRDGSASGQLVWRGRRCGQWG